jgi:hypothetical protein
MNKMKDQVPKDRIADPQWKNLYKVGGAAAMITGVLFVIGVIGLLISMFQPGAINGWLSPFQDNWLVVIFKLHAGFGGVQIDRLDVFNFLDLAILALVGTTVLGLYAALSRASKIWSMIALAQPFLGMVLFIATKNGGRSSVMGAILVISVVILRNNIFNKGIGYLGILAAVLLLVGDLSAGMLHSNGIAILFGVGYALMITWLFLVARRLFIISSAS